MLLIPICSLTAFMGAGGEFGLGSDRLSSGCWRRAPGKTTWTGRPARLRPPVCGSSAENKQMVQAQLEPLAPHELEIRGREYLEGLPHLETVMLLQGHPLDKSQAPQQFQDDIDHR